MENITLTEAYYYILLSLFEPLHGYGIMRKLSYEQRKLTLAAGTLYGALTSLIDKEWINFTTRKRVEKSILLLL